MPIGRVASELPTLSQEEILRYSRHLIIPDVGVEGQRRLKDARVLMVGAGGLGSRLRDANGEPYPYVIFYLDDEGIRFQQGFATPVADGAEILVVPAIAGGR